MRSWRTTTLQEIGRIFDGPHATPSRRDAGPYFLNISSLNNGRLDLRASDHVSDEDFIKWTRRVTPRTNDLLFSYETRLGEAALMPDGVKACLGRRMALIRPDLTVVHPHFLLYLYLSPEFQATIERNTIHGATVNRIPLNRMGSWPISLPPLREQRAIADVLGALDAKIASNTAITATADQLAGGLLESSRTGGRLRLDAVAQITMGTSPARHAMNEVHDGLPFYQGVRDFGFRIPTKRIFTTAPIRVADAGDILVSVRAPVGDVNVANERLCIGRGLASVRSTVSTPATLFHQLRSAREAWLPFEAEGTVFGSINKSQLHGVEIPAVVEGVAAELEVKLAALEQVISSALRESERLAATRDALLPQVITGKLRVRDAEAVASAAGV